MCLLLYAAIRRHLVALGTGSLLLLLCPAFVIGSSRGAGLRGQVRVMRSDVVTVGMATFLENVVTVLDGEQVSEGKVQVAVSTLYRCAVLWCLCWARSVHSLGPL